LFTNKLRLVRNKTILKPNIEKSKKKSTERLDAKPFFNEVVDSVDPHQKILEI